MAGWSGDVSVLGFIRYALIYGIMSGIVSSYWPISVASKFALRRLCFHWCRRIYILTDRLHHVVTQERAIFSRGRHGYFRRGHWRHSANLPVCCTQQLVPAEARKS